MKTDHAATKHSNGIFHLGSGLSWVTLSNMVVVFVADPAAAEHHSILLFTQIS